MIHIEKKKILDFPGGPVVKNPPTNAEDMGLISGHRAKSPHALWPKNQNIKQKHYCNEFNKDLKKIKASL